MLYFIYNTEVDGLLFSEKTVICWKLQIKLIKLDSEQLNNNNDWSILKLCYFSKGDEHALS